MTTEERDVGKKKRYFTKKEEKWFHKMKELLKDENVASLNTFIIQC